MYQKTLRVNCVANATEQEEIERDLNSKKKKKKKKRQK